MQYFYAFPTSTVPKKDVKYFYLSPIETVVTTDIMYVPNVMSYYAYNWKSYSTTICDSYPSSPSFNYYNPWFNRPNSQTRSKRMLNQNRSNEGFFLNKNIN